MINQIQKDWTIKVLAFLISVLMWGFVHGGQNGDQQNLIRERTVSVTPQVLNVGEGMVVMTNLSPVDIRVRASNNIFGSLRTGDWQAFLDLSGLGEGVHKVSLQVRLPAGTELAASPGQVDVRLDRTVTQQVPVAIELSGEPSLGYNASSSVFKPSEVLVTGPRSKVGTVVKAVVEVSVADLMNSVSGTLPVRLIDLDGGQVDGLRVEPNLVDVFVPIMQNIPTKHLPIRVQLIGDPAPGYKVTNWVVEPSFIQVAGPVEYLGQLDSILTTPINLQGLTSDLVKQIDLIIPEGYSSVNDYQTRVFVKIEPIVEKKTFSNITIESKNLSDRYNVIMNENSITLMIEGRPNILEGITSEKIQAWVDLQGVGIGETTLPVQVTVPEGVKVVSKDPSELRVTVTAR